MSKVRHKNVIVSDETIINLLRAGQKIDERADYISVLAPLNLPDGFKCVGIFADYPRRAFVITVEHESFDEVPDCTPAPELHVGMNQIHVVQVNLNNTPLGEETFLESLLNRQRELCGKIELLPASLEQTNLSILASGIAQGIQQKVYPQ